MLQCLDSAERLEELYYLKIITGGELLWLIHMVQGTVLSWRSIWKKLSGPKRFTLEFHTWKSDGNKYSPGETGDLRWILEFKPNLCCLPYKYHETSRMEAEGQIPEKTGNLPQKNTTREKVLNPPEMASTWDMVPHVRRTCWQKWCQRNKEGRASGWC